ncbi:MULTISPECIES: DUF6436 domain-containing protein [unclassified Arsukibacterium]|uniref:DUF6436 domain-containing protein n=1 Tax=unclassified Arsukibacterium TaxID=2635278 RepID=UPI000C9934DE|nr:MULTISPECIES: DUF6436 domain-containing protein [unclassified Arsukibacterium]MAA95024.1 hypothetical protein [Rheinheimera sp.]HAW91989.1 hypothetical protein [Candidatus Azambacteria bacterium]
MLLLVVFVVWVVLASAGLFYFGNQNYGQFDDSGSWQVSAPKALAIETLGIAPEAGKQVVHVGQPECVCNRLASQHIASFTEAYQLPANKQFYRQLQQVSGAGLMLPATPAVLIFDNGQLIYAGPYATGPMCSVSTSLIAPILKGDVNLAGLWLNGEAKACRCVVKLGA